MVPRVLLAAEGLLPKASGIGRVARLVAKVLAEEQRGGRLQARALTLSDAAPAPDVELAQTVCAGSRARFVLECSRAALSCTHFIYDAVSVARAHPRWFRPARPAAIWIHGVEVWESPRPVHMRVLERADCLISNSAFTRARARHLRPFFERAQVCWLATEDDLPPARTPCPGAERHALVLGRIDKNGGRKGHEALIACWPRVVAAVPQARLMVAGGGPAEPLVRSWASHSPAAQHIDVLGFVPEARLDELWSRAGVFAMPSRGEGFGLTYIEAMRHGLPVVGSEHDAAVEVSPHGVSGLNVDLAQPEALAHALIELLGNPERARELGEAGHARWRQHFHYGAFRARFTPILERYLGLAPTGVEPGRARAGE